MWQRCWCYGCALSARCAACVDYVLRDSVGSLPLSGVDVTKTSSKLEILSIVEIKNGIIRVNVDRVLNKEKMMATVNFTRIQHDSTMRLPTIIYDRTNFSLNQTPEICEPDNGHQPDDGKDLKNEANRLKTFTNWPNSSISPETLAKAGFYCLQRNDAVKCAFCGAEGHQWAPGDDPFKDHESWSPNCPYVKLYCRNSRDAASQNVIVGGGSSQRQQPEDVCGSSNEYFPNSAPEDETYSLLKKIGIEKAKPSVYGSYSTLDSRLRSYEEWPKSLKQKPDQLATAGFFYKGVGDQTMCFNCGGGLKDWEDNDDPWEQHALWFPKCSFLILSKGPEFVRQVQKRFNGDDDDNDDEIVVGVPPLSVPSSSSSNKDRLTKEKPSDECSQNKSSDTGDERKSSISSCNSSGNSSSDESNAALCKICYKNEVGIVFIPCGHVVTCVNCSHSLKDTCPVCRKKVDAKIRAFLS